MRNLSVLLAVFYFLLFFLLQLFAPGKVYLVLKAKLQSVFVVVMQVFLLPAIACAIHIIHQLSASQELEGEAVARPFWAISLAKPILKRVIIISSIDIIAIVLVSKSVLSALTMDTWWIYMTQSPTDSSSPIIFLIGENQFSIVFLSK